MPPRSRERAREIARRLELEYPGTPQSLTALQHKNPFQLLVATILSAQSTDERVNLTTPTLFEEFGTPQALANAPLPKLEELIYSTGFFRAKARSLVGMSEAIVERFEGEVPTSMEELTTLPGVGRKTANVVRSIAFGLPGFAVDTHVGRLVRRLGLTTETDPVKVEEQVTRLLPAQEWGTFGLRLILHGRRVCVARKPRCPECILADICPSSTVPVTAARKFVEDHLGRSEGPSATDDDAKSRAGRQDAGTSGRSGKTGRAGRTGGSRETERTARTARTARTTGPTGRTGRTGRTAGSGPRKET